MNKLSAAAITACLLPSGLLLAAAAAQPAAAAARPARAVLADLAVQGRGPMTGYSRAQFGAAWADVDHNGCDTRNDILTRDLTAETYRPGTHNCIVATGRLAEPYTARTITFSRTRASAVQIDHVVALGDAWAKGARAWTPVKRLTFANDPLNLLAVDGPSNQSKGDRDAATWLPPSKAYRCRYVARQVSVKYKYKLTITAAERDAATRVLGTCPTQPALYGGARLPAEPAATASPTPSPTMSAPHPSPTATATLGPTASPAITGAASPSPLPTDMASAGTAAPSPSATDGPAPSPTGPASASPASASPTATATSTYYANCDEARAAGAAPLYAGQPGYRSGLDRDGDGVACE